MRSGASTIPRKTFAAAPTATAPPMFIVFLSIQEKPRTIQGSTRQ